MKLLSSPFAMLASASALAVALQGCATYPPEDTATTASETVQASGPAPVTEASASEIPEIVSLKWIAEPGPALWKVADEDTTIYLFGTVHALPENVEWYRGPIATALGASDMLVTEIPPGAMNDPAMAQIVASKATLPAGQTLRESLDDNQRAIYEGALGKLGLPPAAFDQFEPWFAGMTLAVLPLLQQGWNPAAGAEQVIEKQADAETGRDALETVEFQLGVFDTLAQESQIDFLMATVRDIDKIVPMMDKMVAEWIEGDADQLAEIMNESLTDPVLAEALLYSRNRNWAEWVDTRMDAPGTVFVAVGAGHLAGERSVQDYLAERGMTVERVQ